MQEGASGRAGQAVGLFGERESVFVFWHHSTRVEVGELVSLPLIALAGDSDRTDRKGYAYVQEPGSVQRMWFAKSCAILVCLSARQAWRSGAERSKAKGYRSVLFVGCVKERRAARGRFARWLHGCCKALYYTLTVQADAVKLAW